MRTRPRTLFFCLLIVCCLTCNGQVISTVAGTEYTFPQNVLPALQAPIGNISGVLLDGSGNAYISDINNHIILKVTSDGRISVFAGIGIPGYAGDGGPATSAALRRPRGMAIDPAGNIFIADEANHRVRKVAPDGTISTVAGTGQATFSGDGGPAASAALFFPTELAVNPQGNLCISDEYNHRIRCIGSDGNIRTVAGNGQGAFGGDNKPATDSSIQYPRGIVFDPQGNLYISDQYNFRVRKVDTKGVITTYAGSGQQGYSGDGGKAINGSLQYPAEIALDSAGNLYIAEKENHVIRKVAVDGTLSTFAGNHLYSFSGDGGKASAASLFHPEGVAVDKLNNVFIADSDNNRLRKVDTAGNISTAAGTGANRLSGDGGAATNAVLNTPYALALDSSGGVIFVDMAARVLRRVAADGSITRVAGTGVVGFSGDGGSALQATFTQPRGIAVDRTGNIYVSDSLAQTIRRIGTDGIIRTYAGTPGKFGFTDNTTPAAALFNSPSGIAFDNAGNLYVADLDNNRIRRITATTVTTVAGTGDRGFGGDNGPATRAMLNAPSALAFDAAGNLYFSDSGNQRIRRIDTNGVITTYGGNGTAGFAGDQAAVSGARFNSPTGLSFDSAGNLLIADTNNNRIRRVTPSGIISTIAGTGSGTFAGDGDLATKAALFAPAAALTASNGTIYIADSNNNRIRAIPAAAPTFTAAPDALSFTLQSGEVPSQQKTTLSGSIRGLAFSATASDPWIVLGAPSGVIPGDLTVGVDGSTLAAGNYSGKVTITSPYANPGTRTISVNVAVSAGSPPALSVDATGLTFSVVQGDPVNTQPVTIANSGSQGALQFNATTSTSNGASWLSLASTSGTASINQPGTLQVLADPSALPTGTYNGAINIDAGDAGSVQIPVTMTVSTSASHILLSQTGLTFQGSSNGGAPLSQSVGILNTGRGTMSWQAAARTFRGTGWLKVGTTSGTVATPNQDVAFTDISADPGGLDPGDYYGEVDFTSSADNSPQIVSVLLKVLPPGLDPGPDIRPSALVFTGTAGVSPPSQTIQIANRGSQPLVFDAFGGPFTDVKWFAHLPLNGTLQPNQPLRIVVQPDFTNLASGVRTGALTFSFAGGASPVSVKVISVIGAPAGSQSVIKKLGERDAPCGGLQVQFTSLQDGFSAAIGQGTHVEVKVVDNCGNSLSSNGTSVKARFDNGDDELKLSQFPNNLWGGTWTPVHRTSGAITVNVTAIDAIGFQGGTKYVSGILQSSNSPLIPPQALVHAASFVVAPVAPGGLITVKGSNLAPSVQSVDNLPWPTDLNQVEVLLGGVPLPMLYVSPTQINAQVPYNLNPNTQQQIVVRSAGTISVPTLFTVAEAQPGIFTTDQSGSGQGVIYLDDNATLAQPGSPAHPGGLVNIYCAGLGSTTPAVTAGQAPPPSPVSADVQVRIRGILSNVVSKKLSEGAAGVYIVQAQVPTEVTPGDAIPVTVTVAGQTSPPVTMAVQ